MNSFAINNIETCYVIYPIVLLILGGKCCGVTPTFAVRIAFANPRKLAEKFRKHFKKMMANFIKIRCIMNLAV